MKELTSEQHFKEMLKLWPEMPDPGQQPAIFQHYLKMYKYKISFLDTEVKTETISKTPKPNLEETRSNEK